MEGLAAPAPQSLVLRQVAFLASSNSASPTPWQGFDGSNLVVVDINGDSLPEIVASNDNLRHYVIDPRLGTVVAEMRGSHHGGDAWGGRELNGPAVGDVFGDGVMAIAIDNGDSYLSLWKYDAAGSTADRYQMTRLWESYVDARAWDPNFNDTHPYNTDDTPASEAHPYLADVDGRGQMTIFAQADNIAAHAAYWPNGTLRWFRDPPVDSNAGGIVADLHGDGRWQAVFASDGGPIYVQDARTGAPLWTYDTRCVGGGWKGDGTNCDWDRIGSVTLSPTIADLFGDGRKEICFGTREPLPFNDKGWYGNAASVQANVDASHAKLWCLTDTGKLLWSVSLPFGNPHVAMHPVPFDVNGDGVRDLLWIDWNTIGHHPGDWETTTRGANLFALDGRDGALLWNTSLRSGWSNKDLSLLDFYGDGRQLILAEEYGPSGDDGLGLFDPVHGQRLAWYPLEHGWSATRGPIVADLQGDGYAEIIVPLARWNKEAGYCPQKRYDLPCREGALEILATGKPLRSQFTDSFTWNLKLDAHTFDGTVHTGGPLSASPRWPGFADAPEIRDQGAGNPRPTSPPTSVAPLPSPPPDALPGASPTPLPAPSTTPDPGPSPFPDGTRPAPTPPPGSRDAAIERTSTSPGDPSGVGAKSTIPGVGTWEVATAALAAVAVAGTSRRHRR